VFDPHAVKINIDGSCWDNPGGSGGLGVRVDYGCDIDRKPEVVEYRGYFETNNQRMEIRACIFAHEWIEKSAEDLEFPRFIVLSDSEYVCTGYRWVLGWARNDYRNSVGRPMKNDELWKELMTLRRKLGRRVHVDVKWVPRRSDEGAKIVDTTAKAAGRMPSYVDFGFQKGKIGKPKNNAKGASKLFPCIGQMLIIRPYKSDMARRDLQLFRFEVWDDTKGMFFDKGAAYATNEIGDNLHRQNVYEVRMNDEPRFPQIVEIIWSMKETEFMARHSAGVRYGTPFAR